MFRVQPESGEPLYRQLIRQIEHAVATGLVEPGEKLPTVREMAGELVVNPNTVARAYRELEARGLLSTERGRGTFVVDRPPELSREARREKLRSHVERLVTEALLLRVPPDEVVAQVRREFGEAGTPPRHDGDAA